MDSNTLGTAAERYCCVGATFCHTDCRSIRAAQSRPQKPSPPFKGKHACVSKPRLAAPGLAMPALPCPARPVPAGPRLALPRLACVALPCQASPRQTWPALPGRALPSLAPPSLDNTIVQQHIGTSSRLYKNSGVRQTRISWPQLAQ